MGAQLPVFTRYLLARLLLFLIFRRQKLVRLLLDQMSRQTAAVIHILATVWPVHLRTANPNS